MSLFKNEAEYQEFLRLKEESRNRKLNPTQQLPPPESKPVDHEVKGLHIPIIDWCNAQWPRVKYIHARTDLPSGIAVGCQDFTLFLPGGRVLCIECKSKDGKVKDDQRSWMKEMEMVGHTVHVIRSMEEFFALVDAKENPRVQ